MEKKFDPRCFKCVSEMNNKNGGIAAGILGGKMQQSVANQDLDAIYVCPRHK